MVEVIASGSTGNAVLYNQSILIDCGVPFARIKPYLPGINIVLCTHVHADHLNILTLKRMQLERPGLRVACGQFLVEHLPGIRNIDVIEPGKWYNYGSFKIAAITLFHDVPNFGWRLNIGGVKIIHATDTSTLEGIEAKGYDFFCIEHNYSEETIIDKINAKRMKGEFCHEIGAMNSHLSEEQAKAFIYENRHENSVVIRLHESKSN